VVAGGEARGGGGAAVIHPSDDLANVPGAVEAELGLGDEEAVF
jgi:hypothetical protein